MFQTSADVEPKHFSTSSGGHAGAPALPDNCFASDWRVYYAFAKTESAELSSW